MAEKRTTNEEKYDAELQQNYGINMGDIEKFTNAAIFLISCL